jgi:hypothetical protein
MNIFREFVYELMVYSLFQDITIDRAISSICLVCNIKYLIKLLIDEFYLTDNHNSQ